MIKRVKDEMSAVVSVPNGTAAAGTKLEHFIARGRSLLAQTALGIIGFAVTVIEAEAELSPAEFAQFCAGVRLAPAAPPFGKSRKSAKKRVVSSRSSIKRRDTGPPCTYWPFSKSQNSIRSCTMTVMAR